jgi:hypothetical protein
MRVNTTTPAHQHPIDFRNDRANANVRSKTPIVPRQREKHEALPLTSSVWTNGSYRTGDGEVRQIQRPGSEVAHKLPSKGYAT